MKDFICNHKFVLMEAAVVERLRRSSSITLHPTLVHAPLIEEAAGQQAFRTIYNGYMDLAEAAQLPFLMCTPTWRANHQRMTAAQVETDLNGNAVRFLQGLRAQRPNQHMIKITGLLGCKNDCYLPEQGLSVEEATRFHSWQIEKLARAGVDALIAQTLPAKEEALGLALAMEETGLPYFISFVIGKDGRLLDQTSLVDAIALIDGGTRTPPVGYLINCAYPTFLNAASQPSQLFERLIGYQGNASSLSHQELENAAELHVEPVDGWAREMAGLHLNHQMKLLGGCCGTDEAHLQAVVNLIQA